MTKALENCRIPQQEIQEDDDDLLDQEKDNMTNTHILNRDTTIIFLKRRVKDSHNILKLAKD